MKTHDQFVKVLEQCLKIHRSSPIVNALEDLVEAIRQRDKEICKELNNIKASLMFCERA